MTSEDIARRFGYHPPKTDEHRQAHERVRTLLGSTAVELVSLLPDGREKSLAVTHLEECMFWSNAAVARSR